VPLLTHALYSDFLQTFSPIDFLASDWATLAGMFLLLSYLFRYNLGLALLPWGCEVTG
jgi:hypothetical protein